MKSVHIWVPMLGGEGGIQTFSNFFVKALVECGYGEIFIFSKNNSSKQLKKSNPFIKSLGFSQIPPFLRTLIFSIFIFVCAIKLRPKLIVVTLVNFAPVAAVIKLFFNIPYVVVAHGMEVWKIRKILLKTALKSADKVLSVSCYTQNKMIAQNIISADKASVFSNTYDEHTFYYSGNKNLEIRKKYGLEEHDLLLLSVSRLCAAEKYKGHEIVMNAIVKLKPETPRLFYMVVGDGDYRGELEQKAIQLGVGDRVIFSGRVLAEDLPAYYRTADIFVMPSKGEGFGVVFLEAMGCGKPVIAGNQDGSVDALRRGELGVLVNPESANDVAAAISSVIDKTYPLPILYRPEELSGKVKEYFGFESFKNRLKLVLEPWSK